MSYLTESEREYPQTLFNPKSKKLYDPKPYMEPDECFRYLKLYCCDLEKSLIETITGILSSKSNAMRLTEYEAFMNHKSNCDVSKDEVKKIINEEPDSTTIEILREKGLLEKEIFKNPRPYIKRYYLPTNISKINQNWDVTISDVNNFLMLFCDQRFIPVIILDYIKILVNRYNIELLRLGLNEAKYYRKYINKPSFRVGRDETGILYVELFDSDYRLVSFDSNFFK